MRLITSTFSVVLALTAQCSGGTPSPTGIRVVTGDWSGPHVALALTAVGGSVEYDCAHGGLAAPVSIDRDGYFELAGVHVRERGGPVRIDERPDSVPARYSGRVVGTRMTLRVYAGLDTLGPYELWRDAGRQLFKCL